MEDFVTFEIAKKLKEKGFKQDYNIFGYKLIFSDENTLKHINNIGAYENEYFGINIPCPTISQVLKWLREEKEIYINIQPIPTMATKNKICWGWDLKWDSDGVYIKQKFIDYVNYKTYEEAALTGIEYVLDNLI